jgi:hypothetical protein
VKVIKVGYLLGWKLLAVKCVEKYYSEMVETTRAYFNQTRGLVGQQKTRARLQKMERIK